MQGCFFRQFFKSVSKSDYLALRNGFISVSVHCDLFFLGNSLLPMKLKFLLSQVHLAPGSKFNFQKYIKRSLEDDFKVVVGVR